MPLGGMPVGNKMNEPGGREREEITPDESRSGLAAEDGAGDDVQMAGRGRLWQEGDGVPHGREPAEGRGHGCRHEVVERVPVVNRGAFDRWLLAVLGNDQGDVLAPARLTVRDHGIGISGAILGDRGGKRGVVAAAARTPFLRFAHLLVVISHAASRAALMIGDAVVLATVADGPRGVDTGVTFRTDAKRERGAGERRRGLRQQQHQGKDSASHDLNYSVFRGHPIYLERVSNRALEVASHSTTVPNGTTQPDFDYTNGIKEMEGDFTLSPEAHQDACHLFGRRCPDVRHRPTAITSRESETVTLTQRRLRDDNSGEWSGGTTLAFNTILLASLTHRVAANDPSLLGHGCPIER